MSLPIPYSQSEHRPRVSLGTALEAGVHAEHPGVPSAGMQQGTKHRDPALRELTFQRREPDKSTGKTLSDVQEEGSM